MQNHSGVSATASDTTSVSLFRAQLIVLVVAYTLLVYGGIFVLTRAILADSLRAQAASYIDLVLTTRQWNASHGGVWVLKREGVGANEYLRSLGITPEITTEDGAELVLRNPSAMTRELSELTQEGTGVVFHLVGEDPLNPANAPDEWEALGLTTIDTGTTWADTFERTPGQAGTYRYIEPLTVDASCMGCHTTEQGYSVGQRKGGLSVAIPTADYDRQVARFAYVLSALAALTLAIGIGIVLTMVTRLRVRLNAANSQLRTMAVTDELTGIHNRRATLNRLAEEFERSERAKEPLSVISLDLDHFKNINDVHGHATGDCALQEFAKRTQSVIRTYDVFGRVGGEEFLVIAPGTTLADADTLAGRILTATRQTPLTDCSKTITMTASAGVSELRDSDQNVDSLLIRADEALYQAKAAGRDQVSLET